MVAESRTARDRALIGRSPSSVAVAGAAVAVRAKNTSSRSGVCTDSSSTSIAAGVEPVQQGPQRAHAAVARDLQGERVVVAGASRRARAAASRPAGSANRSRTWPPGTRRLSSSAVPSATSLPPFEHGDPVGELVGLLQVLRGQEDRDAVGDELADDLPHRAAAARVEPGGRLVEEDHPRVADQRHRQVEPAPHAAGVGRGRLLRRLDQVEPLEQLGGDPAGPRARPRWCRSAIRSRFSSPVSRLSTAENWPVTPIAARTASGSPARSCPATRSLAAVGADQRGQDLHGGGLARAVRAQQREDRPARRPPGRCRRAPPCRRTTCAARSPRSRVPVSLSSCRRACGRPGSAWFQRGFSRPATPPRHR